jgi:hypothetical protein
MCLETKTLSGQKASMKNSKSKEKSAGLRTKQEEKNSTQQNLWCGGTHL